MEEGIYDKAINEVLRRHKLLQAEITKRSKGKKPFGMEPVDNDELLVLYSRLTPESLDYAVNRYGYDAVEKRLGELEKIKARRR